MNPGIIMRREINTLFLSDSYGGNFDHLYRLGLQKSSVRLIAPPSILSPIVYGYIVQCDCPKKNHGCVDPPELSWDEGATVYYILHNVAVSHPGLGGNCNILTI